MALDHQLEFGAASSLDGEKPFENDDHEDEGFSSMTCGLLFGKGKQSFREAS